MLTSFFTIIFIAELIIAFQLIHWIVRIDNSVIIMNSKVTSVRPKIKSTLYSVRIVVNKMLLGVYNIEEILEKRKQKVKRSFLKNIIILLVFLMLKPEGKQIFSITDLLLTVCDLFTKMLRLKRSL